MVSKLAILFVRVTLTGNILNRIGQDSNEVFVLECSIFLSLQTGKCALGRVLRDLLLVFLKPEEKLTHGNLRGRLAHQLFVDLFSPLLIVGTNSRMPAVCEVEFDRALVTETRRGTLSAFHLNPRVLLLVSLLLVSLPSVFTYQAPCAVAAIQVDDGAQIIVQRDVDEQAACDPMKRQECVLAVLQVGK